MNRQFVQWTLCLWIKSHSWWFDCLNPFFKSALHLKKSWAFVCNIYFQIGFKMIFQRLFFLLSFEPFNLFNESRTKHTKSKLFSIRFRQTHSWVCILNFRIQFSLSLNLKCAEKVNANNSIFHSMRQTDSTATVTEWLIHFDFIFS